MSGVRLYTLEWNGTETTVRGQTHTVSELRSGTRFTFSLFSVFEDVRSTGVSRAAVTGKTGTGCRFSEEITT